MIYLTSHQIQQTYNIVLCFLSSISLLFIERTYHWRRHALLYYIIRICFYWQGRHSDIKIINKSLRFFSCAGWWIFLCLCIDLQCPLERDPLSRASRRRRWRYWWSSNRSKGGRLRAFQVLPSAELINFCPMLSNWPAMMLGTVLTAMKSEMLSKTPSSPEPRLLRSLGRSSPCRRKTIGP